MAVRTRGSGGSIKISGTGGGMRIISSEGGIIDPGSFPDLVAWYKADSLALSNGNTVTSWPDDSPNNNDLNSYESAPIYNSSDALLNGKPSVTYDSADSSYRSNPTGLPIGSSACTAYVVAYWDGNSGCQGLFGWGANAYTGSRISFGQCNGLLQAESQGMGSATRSISANTPFIYSFPYAAAANYSASTTYLNGVGLTGEVPGFPGVPNIINPVSEIAIGRPPTAAVERWTGAVAEALIFNTTHNSTTRQSVENYLANKYGITLT
jgi:hypothetical protein